MTETAYVNCGANGCPLHGTMTMSTKGTNAWYCFVHFAADAEDWQSVTGELRRLQWLVDVTCSIRNNQFNSDFDEVQSTMHKELMLGQRRDLCRGDKESIAHWLARLEGVLQDSCSAANKQSPLAETP